MQRIEEEFGDLLFVMANVARHLEIDPEKALRGANEKFVRRFQRIEAWLGETGRSPSESDLAEMDGLLGPRQAGGAILARMLVGIRSATKGARMLVGIRSATGARLLVGIRSATKGARMLVGIRSATKGARLLVGIRKRYSTRRRCDWSCASSRPRFSSAIRTRSVRAPSSDVVFSMISALS
jgi:hypothetical protein